MDLQVEKYVRECLGCQIAGPKPPPEPVRMTDSPQQVWHTIHVDYCCPFSSGEYLFVAVDETSKYPEVHITHSSSAATATTSLKCLQHMGYLKSSSQTTSRSDQVSLLRGVNKWA